MKTGTVFSVLMLTGMLTSLNGVYAASSNPGARSSISSLPDLQVKASLVAKRYHAADGSLCYGLRPRYTIMNTGQSAAHNFRVETDWRYNPSHNWQLYSAFKRSVGAGETRQWTEGAASNQPWCTGSKWTAGFRIRVDTLHKIRESNEGNNTASILFIPPKYQLVPARK